MSADAAARVPRIAIVGRQNVGKSTLANRLFGGREAIAHDLPGVTRDRVELEAVWRGRRFGLVDTAGFLSRASGVEALAGAQADRAIRDADLILLVVDASSGITEEDGVLARRVQRAPVPVLLVANKVDSDRDEADAATFNALGLGEPFAVSGMHGRATGDLLDRIVELLPDAPASMDGADPFPRFAIVGRPNVGKSSLFNRLIGRDRTVVAPDAGTTRDAVDDVVEWPDGPVRFVDTAGMRREVTVKGRGVLQLRPRHSGDRSGRRGGRGDRSPRRLHRGGQEDREQGDGSRSRLGAGGEQMGSGRRQGRRVPRPDPHRHPVRERHGHADLGHRWTGVHRLPPVLLDLHGRWTSRVADLEGQRRDPASTAGTSHAPDRRHAALRDPGCLGSARRSLSSVARTRPIPATSGTWRTASGASSTWKGFRSACGSARAAPDAEARPLVHQRAVHSGGKSGRGAAWLARLSGGQKVAGSNPAGPTDDATGERAPRLVRGPHAFPTCSRLPHPADPRVLLAHRRPGHDRVRASCCSERWSRTDWVDGTIARRTGQVSELGKILDPMADRLAIAAGLIALDGARRVPRVGGRC